ncbi:unnamed protein product [Orchesella dallaii]|uniref:F-box domain-containing protein n=1 Tax=Orchesella dallaii TaxID=48710 RepID=A0ABP1S8L2_9HEXA
MGDKVVVEDTSQLTAMDCPPPEKEDLMKVTPVLPLEVWEHIFRYVDLNPTEFLELINSSPEWKVVLKPKVTTVLLPVVLPFLLNHLNASEHLLLKNILSWRRINKSTQLGIDQLLASQSTSPQKYYERVTQKKLSKSRWMKTRSKLESIIDAGDKRGRISCSGNLHSFFRNFQNDVEGECNPFLTRSGKIKISPYMVNDENRLHAFLQRYGHNISALTLKMEANLPLDTVHRLLSLLRRVPNLQILKMTDYFGDVWYEGGGDYGEGRITPINFPNLPHLQCLDWNFTDAERFFRLELQFLEQYGPQLKILICGMNFLSRITNEMLYSLLPNLQCLRMSLQRNQHHFDTLSRLDCPLEEIQFTGYAASAQATELLTAVSKFAPTLTTLQILMELPDVYDARDEFSTMTMMNIMLPNVKKLSTLGINCKFNWFQHVVPIKCTNLEEIYIHRGGVAGGPEL